MTKIKFPDPEDAMLELRLAQSGDREAARRLLERVAAGDFNQSVQTYLMRAAENILCQLEQSKTGDLKLSSALLLNGKQKTGHEGVQIALDVFALIEQKHKQYLAIDMVAEARGIKKSEAKRLFGKFRKEAEMLIAIEEAVQRGMFPAPK